MFGRKDYFLEGRGDVRTEGVLFGPKKVLFGRNIVLFGQEEYPAHGVDYGACSDGTE